MSRIYSVAITTRRPVNASDPGSVAIGFYLIERDGDKRLIRMVTENGETVELNGQQWVRELAPGQNARKLAASLTQSIRIAASEPNFHRVITARDYPDVPY